MLCVYPTPRKELVLPFNKACGTEKETLIYLAKRLGKEGAIKGAGEEVHCQFDRGKREKNAFISRSNWLYGKVLVFFY